MPKLTLYEALVTADGPAGWDYTPARIFGVAVSEAAAHSLALAVAEERWPPAGGCFGHAVELRPLSSGESHARLALLVEESAASPQVARRVSEMAERGDFGREMSEEEAEALLQKIYSSGESYPGPAPRSGYASLIDRLDLPAELPAKAKHS